MIARLYTTLSLLIFSVGLTACGAEDNSDEPSSGRIKGTVTYLERMQLPPGIRVEVFLEDISRPDAPAKLLRQIEMFPDAGPPYAFSIDYEQLSSGRRGHYALRATISLHERLFFTSTEYIDPFADNPVEIRVHRVPGRVPDEASVPVTE